MAQNVTVAGASYPDVPSVELPTTGGGTSAFYDVSDTTAASSDVASGKYFFSASGVLTLGTATGGGAVSVVDTQAADGSTIREITAVDISSDTVSSGVMLDGYTAHNHEGAAITGSIQSQAAQTITPTGSDQTIPAGKYLSGAQTIEGIVTSNLTAANIISGVTVKVGTATDDDSVASVTGTASGGPTLLHTESLGNLNVTSTVAVPLNKTITVNGVGDYDILLFTATDDAPANDHHVETLTMAYIYGETDISTKDGTYSSGNIQFMKSADGTMASLAPGASYGIYPRSSDMTISGGTFTAAMYGRYNSTRTRTIDGTYTLRVYGIKASDI